MIQTLNAFMLHELPLEEICQIARAAGCGALCLEPQHLEPGLSQILKSYNLRVDCVGSLFLNLDMPEEGLHHGLELVRLCAEQGIHGINLVLQSRRREEKWLPDATTLCGMLADAASEAGILVAVEPLHPGMRDVSCLTNLQQVRTLCHRLEKLGFVFDVCHCSGMDNVRELLPLLSDRIASVHLSDQNSAGNRCFPGCGSLPLDEVIRWLNSVGYRRGVELEVISPEMTRQPAEWIAAEIRSAFFSVTTTLVVGELALHSFVSEDHSVQELGGGAGVIASQMNELGVSPYLVGACGKDQDGDILWERFRADRGFSVLDQQEGARTSVVSIRDGEAKIQVGTVDPEQLRSLLRDLPDRECTIYLPAFPGYDGLRQEAAQKKNWSIFSDFGFYRWCGDARLLVGRLQSHGGGFCALINAKGLPNSEKLPLGRFALDSGFRYAILTDETRDLLLFHSYGVRSYPVEQVSHMKCTCGAGDCLSAGILAGLSRNLPMEDAVDCGMKTAWHKVQTDGIWRR